MGLANGDMLLIGGKNGDLSVYRNSVWRLSAVSGEWTEDVALQKVILFYQFFQIFINPNFKPIAYGSTINVNNIIYVFPGNDDYNNDDNELPIQLIKLGEDSTIEQTDIIGYHALVYYYPIVYAVESNPCPAL